MPMNLANLLRGYKGIKSKPQTLASTTAWYLVKLLSEKVELILVFNMDDTDDLRVAILEKGLDPRRTRNFTTEYGFFLITAEDYGALSVELDIWLQPTTSDQAIYTAQFSKEMLDSFKGKKYGVD